MTSPPMATTGQAQAVLGWGGAGGAGGGAERGEGLAALRRGGADGRRVAELDAGLVKRHPQLAAVLTLTDVELVVRYPEACRPRL